MKKFIAVLMVSIMAISMFGCKKEEAKPEAKGPEIVSKGDQARSFLTGQWVDKDIVSKRPAAIMMSNTPDAPVISGSSQASVIYEAPGEGDYATRLMGIFEDWEKLEKVGSVRSCRTYYVYYMMEFDAIYVHAGQAAYALPYLDHDFVNNLSATQGEAELVFFNTEAKAPHNTYTSGEGIMAGAKKKEYRLEHESDYKKHYIFNEDDENMITLDGGKTAEKVVPGYAVNKPWFEFNESDGLYYRYQNGEKHLDANNNEQLAVSNIIIQYSHFATYDDTHYWDIDETSGGKGVFVTNGKAIDITWKKDSEWGITHYYNTKGEEITLNQGKTWVCIVNDSYKSTKIGTKAEVDEKSTKKS